MTIEVRSNEPVAKSEPKVSPGEGTPAAHESAPDSHESEQNEASESETESKESEVSEEHEEEKEESEQLDDSEKDKTKKKSGFQRRIDKLNARYSATQQELEYWKQKALEGASGTNSDKPEAPKPAAAEGEPNPDDYDTHAGYVKAVAKWEAKQLLKEERQKVENTNLKAEQDKRAKSHFERVKAFAEKTEDWADAMESLEDVPNSPAVEQIIMESENGPELLYELAKNPDEAKRICSLSPVAAAREMGKLEARLTSKAPESSSKEAKKITKAPKPIEPVNAGGKGTVTKSLSDPNLTQAEYERLRKEQMKKRQA